MSAYAISPVPFDEYATCCNCGVAFASPVIAERRKDGKSFTCPNGHSLHFGDTETSRLRRELEIANQRKDWWRSQQETAQARLNAQRGQTTKLRRKLARVHNGVCPECNRSFKQLSEHMKAKHPEVKK